MKHGKDIAIRGEDLQGKTWETLPDSQVRSAGFVRFDENRDGSKRSPSR